VSPPRAARRRRRWLPPSYGRGPLAIASFLAIPLFFSSLMSTTLALEKARVVQWNGPHHLITIWHDPSTANVTRIWLWALVPPLVLVLVGAISTRFKYGFYVPCVAAILIAMAVVHKTGVWERHHTSRFPLGVDNIPASNAASNKYDPGQWEKMARETAISLQHWTIGIALAAMLVTAGLAVRRRYFARRAAPAAAPLEGVHAPDVTQPSLGDPLG
jgi:hypothetical protein